MPCFDRDDSQSFDKLPEQSSFLGNLGHTKSEYSIQDPIEEGLNTSSLLTTVNKAQYEVESESDIEETTGSKLDYDKVEQRLAESVGDLYRDMTSSGSKMEREALSLNQLEEICGVISSNFKVKYDGVLSSAAKFVPHDEDLALKLAAREAAQSQFWTLQERLNNVSAQGLKTEDRTWQ